MVDSLAGLRKREAFTEAAVPLAGSPPYFGNLFTDLHGVQWQEINLQILSQHADFLGIGA